jgi:hypothetical protein
VDIISANLAASLIAAAGSNALDDDPLEFLCIHQFLR